MFRVTPELVRIDSESSTPALGWFVPGGDCRKWIRASRAFEHDRHGCRYYVMPRALNDRAASGLVCLCDSAEARREEHQIPEFIQSVGLKALQTTSSGAVWVPNDGDVFPRAAAGQLLDGVLNVEYIDFVWLTGCGLVRFERSDAVRISDFVSRPKLHANRNWTTPPATTTLPDRITDIRLLNPPTLTQMFGSECDSIGDQSHSLKNLNDDGTIEHSGPKGWLNQKLTDWLERNEERERNAMADSEGAGNPPSKFSQYLSQKLKVQRDKQIEKLLNLMKTDPDRALQFAIPMGGLGQTFRGLANAGANLTRRSTDFSLPELFGGSGPADLWQMDANLQAQLRASYQEQAKREAAAGRYRRAAYIYAHLLGDYASAAALLEQGGHYSEAAVLYDQHLGRSHDQARCLAACGQSGQAAEIYERLEEYEKAAEVWESTGDTARAREVYEVAVQKKIESRQVVSAAEMLIEKLDQPDQAEALLWDQWPHGAQPFECAKMAFERCAVSGRHDLTVSQYDKMSQSATGVHDALLAGLSAWLVRDYPNQALKEIAEDRCRIAATNNIRDLSDAQIDERLEMIRSMHEGEKILARDLRRFQRAEQQRLPKLRAPISKSNRIRLTRVPSLRLPSAWYQSATPIGKELFAVGRDSETTFLRAANLDCESPEFMTVSLQRAWDPEHGVATCIEKKQHEVNVHIVTSPPDAAFPMSVLPPILGGSSRWSVQANRLGGVSRFGADGKRWTLLHDSMTLQSENKGAISTYDLAPVVQKSVDEWRDSYVNLQYLDLDRLFLDTAGNWPVIVFDRIVVAPCGPEFVEATVLDASPTFVASSLPYTRARMLIGTPQFLKIVWMGYDFTVDVICNQGGYHHGCFLFGGRLAVTTDQHLRLFERNQKTTRMVSEEKIRSGDIVEVFPIGTDIVGILYRDGMLDRYRINR